VGMLTSVSPARAGCRASVLVVAASLIASASCAERRGNGVRSDPPPWRRPADPGGSVEPVDRSGPVPLDDTQFPRAKGVAPERGAAPDAISSTVDAAVRPVQEEGFQGVNGGGNGKANGARGAPAAAPGPGAGPGPVAPAPARDPGAGADTTGGFQLVGTVLAEVHDTPIFADRVLGTVDKQLAADARRLDEKAFRAAAADTIQKQIREYIYTELEFAMAKRELAPRDQELARLATIRWLDEQVTRAGGSPEVARQRAAAAGYDFDELQEDQYRLFMRRLYYEKREYPKIQVSAADMRRYYQEHLKTEFTRPDRARFRVIMVDKRKAGGRPQALGEINRLLDRARSGGKDFAELAAEDNDEDSFKRPVDWFQRGSFVVKEVEDAVWKLRPGQITDVIETPDAFYIARLDAHEPGGVLPFGEYDVQRQIEKNLRDRQFAALRAKVQQQLIADAIIRYHPRMIELAVEMAMQKYRYWREAAAR
jgi:parvulin-like peptidyl-prolyl isomerase